MKRFCLTLLVLAVSLVSFAQSPNPEGHWLGHIQLGGLSLRFVLNVAKQADGSYLTTVDSPDQGAKGIKTSSFSMDGDKLKFTVFGGKYEGKFSPDGKQIVGNLAQGGQTFPLTLEYTEKAVDTSKPQDPKPPYPYDSEDVTYENMKEYVHLAGTITKPKGDGPFPAVVLITGSGPQNRNEEILGHRPFWVLADYLTRRGIEVLRVDDRGVGGSSGSNNQSTTADFVTDVITGVQFLESRPEVDKKHIGLIGHSEGGIIAPMVASQCKDIDFIVMMAGTGMSGRDLLPLQAAAVAKASGAKPAEVDETRRGEVKMLSAAVSAKDEDGLKAAIKRVITEEYAKAPAADRAKMPSADQAVATAAAQLSSPWFRYFLTLDPIPYLENVKCSVLALGGSLDTQVPAKVNLPLIRAALERGGNTHYTVKELPGLNHLFQTAKTGSPMEYSDIQETLAPLALQTMGDWILATVKN